MPGNAWGHHAGEPKGSKQAACDSAILPETVRSQVLGIRQIGGPGLVLCWVHVYTCQFYLDAGSRAFGTLRS